VDNLDYYLEIDRTSFFYPLEQIEMIKVFQFGIILGLIPIPLGGGGRQPGLTRPAAHHVRKLRVTLAG
jgi:hypothetical protein